MSDEAAPFSSAQQQQRPRAAGGPFEGSGHGGWGGHSGRVEGPDGFTVSAPQAFEFTGNVAGGVGNSPYAYGGGSGNGSPPLPQLHPGLPAEIWVLDPLTRKLRVPTHQIIPTAATATLGSTPSLCLAFLESRCRHPWCRQAHIPLAVVQRLRQDAQNAPTCCHEHKSPHDIAFLTGRFRQIDIAFSNGHKVGVPTSRLAVTVGLQRHLAQVVPKNKQGSFEVSSRMVCRLHLNHRCRYLEDCNNLHVCREFEAITNAFAEMGPDRSPVTAGTPAQPPSSQGQGTPLAGGTPLPLSPQQHGQSSAPPRYGESTASRSPPFNGLPPPSPLISPANSYSPAPGTPAAPPYGSVGGTSTSPAASRETYAPLASLNAGTTTVSFGGRTYNVMQLRSGSVTDAEFASIAEMQASVLGTRIERVDFVSTAGNASASKPASFTAGGGGSHHGGGHHSAPGSEPQHGMSFTTPNHHGADAPIGMNSSLTALPPPADPLGPQRARESGDRWSAQTTPARNRGGGPGTNPSAPSWQAPGTSPSKQQQQQAPPTFSLGAALEP